MNETILKVQHLGKSFGTHEILKDIDFSVKLKDVPALSVLPAPVNPHFCVV